MQYLVQLHVMNSWNHIYSSDQFKMDGKDELKRHEDKGEMNLW